MFLKSFRYIFGTVDFIIDSKSTERFLNLIKKSNIKIFNIKKYEDFLQASVIFYEFEDIKSYLLKHNIILKIKNKSGFPYLLQKYYKRVGIILGIFCFSLTLYVLSMFVWSININCNMNLDENEVKNIAKEVGLYSGILKKKIDVKSIEKEIELRLHESSWVSVNIDGSVANIMINSKLDPPEIVQNNNYCNIKATMDAQIIAIRVFKGTAQVKNGDAVEKGQLLVSGEIEDVFGEKYFVHAQAKAIAYTKHEYKDKIDYNQKIIERTGKKKIKKNLNLFGLNIPILYTKGLSENYEKEEKTKIFKIASFDLPINLSDEIWFETIENIKCFSKEEILNEAEKRIDEYKNNNLKDVIIIKEDKNNKFVDDNYVIEETYYCQEDIALEEEF